MKIIRDTTLKNGTRRVLVEVSKDAELYALHKDCHVRLGYPVEDVMHSSIVLNLNVVSWCSVEQRWVD